MARREVSGRALTSRTLSVLPLARLLDMTKTHQTIGEKHSRSASSTPPPTTTTKKSRPTDSPIEVKVDAQEHTPVTSPQSSDTKVEQDTKEQMTEQGKDKTDGGGPSPSRPGELPPAIFGPVGEGELRTHGVLEEGQIYFLYRPKIDSDEPHSIDEIAR